MISYAYLSYALIGVISFSSYNCLTLFSKGVSLSTSFLKKPTLFSKLTIFCWYIYSFDLSKDIVTSSCSYEGLSPPKDSFVVISFKSFGVEDGFESVLMLLLLFSESYFELELRDYDFLSYDATGKKFFCDDCWSISRDDRGE